MSIPSTLCFFHLDTVRLPKRLVVLSIKFIFTSSSTCHILLSSTYHAIVHCLSLMMIFYIHLSYVLTRNPCDFRLFEYRSYHSSVDSIHPYRASISFRYSTFTPLSTRTFFLCLVFTSHIMSTNPP